MDKGHEATPAERARNAQVDAIKESPTLSQAWNTISLSELGHITSIPCARSSLLYGVAAATLIGTLKFVMNKKGGQALNWGAGTFMGVSLATFEGCRFQRYQERMRMKYAVDRVEIRRKEAKSES